MAEWSRAFGKLGRHILALDPGSAFGAVVAAEAFYRSGGTERGETNQDLPRIKDALRGLGYTVASTDDGFDAETEAAIVAAQASRRDERGLLVEADGRIKNVRDKWVLLADAEEQRRLWDANGYIPQEGD